MDNTKHRRIIKACDLCRRKKIKCPGERPICSICERLGQPCEYLAAEQGPSQDAREMNARMSALESKLEEMGELLRANLIGNGTLETTPVQNTSSALELSGRIQSSLSDTVSSADDQELLDAGQLYLTWCNNQPLSLFKQEGFLESLKSRDKELRLAIQMLTYRYPPRQATLETQQMVAFLNSSSRKLVVDRISNGKVKLSTLQTLCLLSTASFADGSVMQAEFDLKQAQFLCSLLPSGSSLGDPVEYSLCIQNISLLQSLQGFTPDLAKHVDISGVFQNSSRLLELMDSQRKASHQLQEHDMEVGHGMLWHLAQAAEVWHMARVYAATRIGPDSPPPWSQQSDYGLISLRNLELDCHFPLQYRFATNPFHDFSTEALQQRRDYWGPWLFIQFLHAAIPTLLNHPFLLSLRLRNFRHMMPKTFMYQSFDLLSRYTTWIICYLDLLESKNFHFPDPIVGHCVVIVATIHLQHSFVEDDNLRKKAQHGYDKCIRFLDGVSRTCPFILSMTKKLRELRDSIILRPNLDEAGGQDRSDQPWSINAQLLWDLLIFEKAGRDDHAPYKSLFDDRISPGVEQQQDVTEFAMVGSAGIAGHKTVSKIIQAYAPQDSDPYKPLSTPTSGGTAQGLDEFFHGGHGSEEFRDLNMMDQGDLFLQAEDFGRAVHDWMRFDIRDIA